MPKITSEFERFDHTMQRLIKVPHGELQAKLESEKRAKQKRKAKRPSASGRAASEKD